MELTMKIPSIIPVLFSTFTQLDRVSGASSCVGCMSFQSGQALIDQYKYSPSCMSANASVISSFASSCRDQGIPDYISPDQIGCQTAFIFGADKITLEKVSRGCIYMETFRANGLDPVVARTPAGICFNHPTLGGALSCVCASRDNCNVYPSVGKDSSGKFVPTALQPDAKGSIIPGSSAADITDPVRNPPKSPTNSNSNSNTNSNANTNMDIANGNGSDKAGTADDQSKVTANGADANGSQDSTSGATTNCKKASYFVSAFLFAFTLNFGLVMSKQGN